MNLPRTLTVGEVSKRSGVAVSAIHFYESKGLIQCKRTNGQQRRFERETLRMIAFIKTAQNLGFSLTEIKGVFDVLPKNSAPGEREWRRMASNWRRELDERIQRLKTLRHHLDRCIGCGCLSLKECPLRNNGDKLAKKGPGAHLL